MALNQHIFAQSLLDASGHAVRAGHTAQQPQEQPAIAKFAKNFPSPPIFGDALDEKLKERKYLKGRLAAAFRIFGARGFDEGVAGHISVRDPVEPKTFWINPFGLSFSNIRRSDLLRVDWEGNVLEGGQYKLVNRAAIVIHRGVHEARPDIISVAHSHSIYGRAFSTLGTTLPITTQDACGFYNDIATSEFGGIVLEGDEGEHIAQALGNKKALILHNHGLLTTANTVEATVFWYVSLEKLCHIYLTALAAVGGDASKVVPVKKEDAEETYKSLGLPLSGWFSAKPLFDEIAEQTHEAYLA